MVPGVSLKHDIIWCIFWYGSYVQWGMMLWHLLTSSLLSFCLKAFSLFFSMATFAQCTNQNSNCVYAGTNLRHNGWYDTKMIWYVCNGWCRPLMCTSNVAGNTQMASLDRQVTQNGLGVNNAIARGIYNGVDEVTVLCDDDSRCSWCRYQDDGTRP